MAAIVSSCKGENKVKDFGTKDNNKTYVDTSCRDMSEMVSSVPNCDSIEATREVLGTHVQEELQGKIEHVCFYHIFYFHLYYFLGF